MMRLCYWLPGLEEHVDAAKASEDDEYWWAWAQSMVDSSPDAIFFFTVETTDIFPKE